MKFKLLVPVVFLAMCSQSSAAGPYDGIYQLGSNEEWYTVHQSGNRMVVANFLSDRAFPTAWRMANGQNFGTLKLDYWNLFGGTISGAHAALQGEVFAGACIISANADFSVVGRVTVTITGAAPTAAGSAQGIDCSGTLAAASIGTLTLTKIF